MIGKWIEDHFGWVITLIMGLVIVLLVAAVVADSKHRARLMAQCQADDKPEYECFALMQRR